MKKKILAAVIISVLLIGAVFTVSYTTDDPLITESYLNNVFFQKVKDYIAGNQSGGGESSSYKLITVNKGGSLAANEGCEFIVRQGDAKVVVSSLGGISDITDGKDIISGHIPLNHLMVVPRSDGRGFVAETNVLVMVKGPYKVY